MRIILFSLLLSLLTFVQAEEQTPLTGWNTRALGRALIEFGSLQDKIASLDPLIEQGDHTQVKRAVGELRWEVKDFGGNLKELVAENLHEDIDEMIKLADGHLIRIEHQVTADNMEQARDEYRALKANWSQLDTYVANRATDILRDKGKVKGWLNWLLDWWYGADE